MRLPATAGLAAVLGIAILALTPPPGRGPGADEAASRRAGETGVSGNRRLRLVRLGVFNQPLYVTQPPGDRRRLFVVEKGGRVRVIRGGRTLKRPFLSLRGEVSRGTEQGLLSMAFAPDYRRSRRFYVSFTNRRGSNRIQEFRRSRRSPDRADKSTRRLVMRVHQPRPTHNGGHILFGPEGLLYVGIGDGGGPGDPGRNGQDRSTLLGKILRIDPRPRGRRRYRSPGSNPFVRRRGARDEIYAYGLRNPWRFSFDRETGAMLIGDVGQNRHEEVDYLSAHRARGANLGWSAFEGRHRFNRRLDAPGHVRPIHAYPHGPACSITGGHVVRDRALGRLYGRYLYGDFCDGRLRSLRPAVRRAHDPRFEGPRVPALSSFGTDRRGRIYVTSLAGGVYRLAFR